MKDRLLRLLALTASLVCGAPSGFAQTSAFTYQGRFNTNNVPYTGSAEFQFTLWDAASGGSAVATNNPVAVIATVTDGLFTATLEFGSNPFNGQPRFLQIDARTTIGAFTPLTPRQPLTPTPYALRALNLTTNGLAAGTYASAVTFNNAGNSFNGSFTGSGAGLTGLNASQLTSGLVPDARLAANVARTNQVWLLGGNPGANAAYLGTTDTNALELRVNGQRTLRIEHATNFFHGYSPNIVGGHPNNVVSNGFVGAVIGGGGSTIYGLNRVGAQLATVVGGAGNTASAFGSTAMGHDTTASGSASTAMGKDTTASGDYSTAMDNDTTASGNYSTAMGRSSRALHDGTFVWADNNAAAFASTAVNQFLIRASGGVGIGTANPDAPLHVTGGTDASLGGGGNLVLGNLNSGNLVLDGNEIMARDFGGTATLFLNFNGGDVQTGSSLGVGRSPAVNALEVSGTASKSAAGSWLANSDARIKRDITPVTDALATLGKVRLVSFDYTPGYRTGHPEVEARRHLNVIAQEFREVFPEHVKSSGEKLPDGSEILQVDTYPLTIYSAAAVQELAAKVEQKDAKITALEARLEKLERMMAAKGGDR